MHAFGAVMDNPDLLALAVVGDGEAETGPLEGSWKGISFLNPRARRRRAADPAPQRRTRSPARPCSAARTRRRSASLLEGHGYDVIEVEGDDLPGMHHRFAAALAEAWATITAIQARGPRRRLGRQPAALADDRAAHAEGLDRPGRGRRRPGRRHVARPPGAAVRRARRTPSTCAMLEAWLRSYRPEELFDEYGRPDRARAAGEPGAATCG